MFDNYQELAPDSVVHEVLTIATSCLSQDLTIMVIRWAEPLAQLARARSNGDLVRIGWEVLRFTEK